MIKVIIFDWGDVFAFYNKEDFLNKVSNYFNIDRKLFEEVELKNRLKHDLGKISTREFVANLNKELNRKFSVKEYYSLLETFEHGKLNINLVKLVKSLKKDYKIFLLSNNSKPVYDSILNSNLKNIFDKMLFSFQVGIKKPNKDFFNLLLKGTSFSFKDCLFIDDRESTCITAKSYGIQSIVFKNNEQLKRELALLKIT